MSSYLNAYEIVAKVRRAVNEYSTGKMQATDTSGPFSNELILDAIHDAQKFIFDLLFVRCPHLFLSSSDLTGSSSVYTLPSDFLKLRRFETSDKVKISLISVDGRHLNDNGGSKYLYYRQGNTLVIDKDGLGDTCTIWYYTRPRRIDMGKVQTGGVLSMTLATSARKEVDYYNNMIIEDITADFSSTISDYSAARVATIAATAGTADYYGIVPELPEEFHHLISRRAIMIMKGYPQNTVPLVRTEYEMFKEDLVETIRSYVGDLDIGDVTPEDVFMDLEPLVP